MHNIEHLVGEIPQETLVIAGMLDGMLPAYNCYEMHRKLPNSRLECWTLGTHFLVCEFPQSSMDVLQRFLRSKDLCEYDDFTRQGLRFECGDDTVAMGQS